MNLSKILLILVLLLFNNIPSNSFEVNIEIKIQDQIITNIDILNEKKYLYFLNPKLENIDDEIVNKLAKESLIKEIIKKNEISKFFNFNDNKKINNIAETNLLKSKNIHSRNDFKEILKNINLNYKTIENKLKIETLWSQLIYEKYKDNVKVNKKKLRDRISKKFINKKKTFEYNLSEIVLSPDLKNNLDLELNKIIESIQNVGFENTANIYSISNTAKNGGLIGWVNEAQLSQQINNTLKNLDIYQISKPIEINNGYILLKINNKKKYENKINIDEQFQKALNKEINKQLNNFSNIYYKKLKKNIRINEF
tara:strand:- start:1594 stop:2526 length:933 start_codon:yes stop_codon:yes gene_type:complete